MAGELLGYVVRYRPKPGTTARDIFLAGNDKLPDPGPYIKMREATCTDDLERALLMVPTIARQAAIDFPLVTEDHGAAEVKLVCSVRGRRVIDEQTP